MADNVHQLPNRGTVLPPLSTIELDLDNLPERLNDEQLAAVRTIAKEPLPALPPCDERHLAKCLRIMLAVLPKQSTDEVGGELFVEAYCRHLAEYPNEAISYLANVATGTRKWFPTIAECHEILKGWWRSDDATARRAKAQKLAWREKDARLIEDIPEPLPPMTQEQVDTLPEPLVNLGLSAGFLERDEQGNVKPAA